MKKAQFVYKKKDGTSKERELLHPKFLKESFNSFKTLDHESVKYVQGYELDSTDLTEEQIKQYEEAIQAYLEQKTLEETLSDFGLEPKRVSLKTFSKEGVEEFLEQE